MMSSKHWEGHRLVSRHGPAKSDQELTMCWTQIETGQGPRLAQGRRTQGQAKK